MKRDQFYLQDVVERKLGRNLVRCRRGARVRWSFKHGYAYDVQLLKSLRQLLSNESILSEVILMQLIRVCDDAMHSELQR